MEFTPLLLTLPSLTPSLAVEILPHGLTVHRLIVQADGKTHDIVIGPENPEDHVSEHHRYNNTIIGRYSNRIPTGLHELSRNRTTSVLHAKLPDDGKVMLHGGPVGTGFDCKFWEPVPPGAATLFSPAELSTISTIPSAAVFRAESEDGEQGFPGRLLVEVLVGLLLPGQGQTPTPNAQGEYPLGSLLFVYRAKLLDEGKKVVTPLNLTQHWGFNLEASLNDDDSSLDVKNHTLTMHADRVIDLDSLQLSTGKLNPVEGTHHHHASKRIGDAFPSSGYDEFYVFKDTDSAPDPTRVPLADFSKINFLQNILKPKAASTPTLVELASKKSGLKLKFESNQPGVQFYTSNFIKPESSRKKIHGGSGAIGAGDGYRPGAFAFLEFHEPLAAWLHPESTKPGEDTLLTSDELYHNWTKIDVLFKSPTA